MSLLLKINDDLKNAMKAKDEAKLSTLRMLKAALKNKQIDLRSGEAGSGSAGHELSEEEVLAVVKSQMKLLKDSLESFAQGGRADLAEGVKKEVVVLEVYLPAQMDEATLQTIVKKALADAGMTSKADAGKAMGVAMKAVAGRADGTRVRAIVEATLTAFVLLCLFHPSVALAASQDAPPIFLETILRIARIFFLLMGIVCINSILIGGFTFMVGSGRYHAHHEGLQKISWGILGSVLMAGLFAVATAMLQKVKMGA